VTKVYRVERISEPCEGLPWKSSDDNGLSIDHWGWFKTPACSMQGNKVCGVTSLRKLQKWFPSKIKKEIHKHEDLQIVILDVPKIIFKDKLQVVFRRNKAKIIGRLLPNGKAQYLGTSPYSNNQRP